MSILSNIHSPEDVKRLSLAECELLCEELRKKIVETVSVTGGHLASNLGVVELTTALHRVFSVPQDAIVWDVGHQCYAHKLLTGRLGQFNTLRQSGGLSGFPKPAESKYDAFVAGHSSTSVSAANGLAKAKTLAGEEGHVIAVIGDGAMTGGLAYEGLTNAGRSDDKLIVVLNDNRMSINQNVGFVARHLATLRSGLGYVQAKNRFGNWVSRIPAIGKPLFRFMVRVKYKVKSALYHNSSMFEEMGYYYLGPVNGHSLVDLTNALQTAKNLCRPVLLHIETIKGQGYAPAMQNPDVYHGISAFDVQTGEAPKSETNFSKVVGECLTALAKEDNKLCVITAAMKSGTGLTEFAKQFPKRFFDVGIAEEHAVTFTSGLAAGGFHPVFAVYSTFLQRAYDQLLNDTAIMNNHVVLAVDRAGIVPDDGETHQGIFDVPFLSTIPNMTIYSPATFAELNLTMKQALYDTTGIAAVRYPRGGELGDLSSYQPDGKPYTLFKNPRAQTLVITYGRLFSHVVKAAEVLKEEQPLSILKLTKIHPIADEVYRIAGGYRHIVFFEEGAKAGGIAMQFAAALAEYQYRGNIEIHAIEGFVPTCSVTEGLRRSGLDVTGMIKTLRGDGTVGTKDAP